jgi:nucleotide-binding universal stress UspA family protein
MFKQILVPLDGSPLAEQALGEASLIARHAGGHLDVILVHQSKSVRGVATDPDEEQQLEKDHAYLETIVAGLPNGAAVAATHALLRGEDVVETISARAHDLMADLIVITSHGRTGLSRTLLGSVADALIRTAAIPVLMLRSQSRKKDRAAAPHNFQRILVLLDGSKESQGVLSAAASLGAASNADLVLLRVVQPMPLATANAGIPFGIPDIGIPSAMSLVEDPQATEERRAAAMNDLSQIAATLDRSGTSNVETHVAIAEHVAPSIIDFVAAHDIDVVAMCTHGRGASRLFMGSVADKVLQGTHLPMLMYRPNGK